MVAGCRRDGLHMICRTWYVAFFPADHFDGSGQSRLFLCVKGTSRCKSTHTVDRDPIPKTGQMVGMIFQRSNHR